MIFTEKIFLLSILSNVCCPKKHSKNCGYLSKSVLRGARTNLFYCLLHGNDKKDPDTFASPLNVLGKYHAYYMIFTLGQMESVIFTAVLAAAVDNVIMIT